MHWRKFLEHRSTPFLPSALVVTGAFVGTVIFGTEAPAGFSSRWPEVVGLAAAGTLAALHRPLAHGLARHGGHLGLATLVLPVALARLGPLAAAGVAFVVALAAALWRRAASRAGPLGAGLSLTPTTGERLAADLDNALLAAGTVWAAGAFFFLPNEPGRQGIAALAYVAVLLVLLALRQYLREGLEPHDLLPLVGALGLDAAGWFLGILLLDVARVAGWARAGALMTACALLAAEAARLGFRGHRVESRMGDLERLQHAHKRILSEVSGMGEIAQQVLTECRNVLPVAHFQFELADGNSWAAGPEGILAKGAPRPPGRPAALPGVHRRATWRMIEKKLAAEGETLAVLRLWCDPRRIEDGAEDLFAVLLPQMASSLHRARLDREAKTDPLTGVPVRRLFESRLQSAFKTACEEGSPIAVVLCDIDHFKKINDTYGHAAGDEALKLFAHTLEGHRRRDDLCCRYGGEEFTVLLERTRGDLALELAERLRRAVEALDFEYEGRKIVLRMSVGVASFPELYIKTASELLLLADEALYEAKDKGRNRCLLNLGRGAFRAPTETTGSSRDAPPPKTPHFFS